MLRVAGTRGIDLANLFVFGEIDWFGLIFFSFIIGNFCCWANFFGVEYFVLDLIY